MLELTLLSAPKSIWTASAGANQGKFELRIGKCKVAPLCRKSTGSITPKTKWLHIAENSQWDCYPRGTYP